MKTQLLQSCQGCVPSTIGYPIIVCAQHTTGKHHSSIVCVPSTMDSYNIIGCVPASMDFPFIDVVGVSSTMDLLYVTVVCVPSTLDLLYVTVGCVPAYYRKL